MCNFPNRIFFTYPQCFNNILKYSYKMTSAFFDCLNELLCSSVKDVEYTTLNDVKIDRTTQTITEQPYNEELNNDVFIDIKEWNKDEWTLIK